MKKFAVVGGYGKMGTIIYEKLKNEYEIIRIGKNDDLKIAKDARLIIDFSTGKNSVMTALWCEKNNKPLIIGATGQTETENQEIFNYSKHIAILKAGNFSLGILALKNILKTCLNLNPESITIIEKHHKNKLDKPSGTALELNEIIRFNGNVNSEILSIRGGKEIGKHSILIYFGNEVLELTHQAFSRDVFACGLELAIKFMLSQKNAGLYSFEDCLELK